MAQTGHSRIIVIDIAKIKRTLEEVNDIGNLEKHIKDTIVHEVGHAIQDSYSMSYDENEAEEFAIEYVDFGCIVNFWSM